MLTPDQISGFVAQLQRLMSACHADGKASLESPGPEAQAAREQAVGQFVLLAYGSFAAGRRVTDATGPAA